MVDKFWVVKAMQTYGGSFMQALAEALTRADLNNEKKIRATWEYDLQKYEIWAEVMQKEYYAAEELRQKEDRAGVP